MKYTPTAADIRRWSNDARRKGRTPNVAYFSARVPRRRTSLRQGVKWWRRQPVYRIITHSDPLLEAFREFGERVAEATRAASRIRIYTSTTTTRIDQ